MRFWLTVAVFAICNCAAWVWFVRSPGQVQVLERPEEGEILWAHQGLRWRFSAPLTPEGDGDPVRFQPPLAGEFRWDDGGRILRFRPGSGNLPVASPVTWSLEPGRLRGPDGLQPPNLTGRLLSRPLRVEACQVQRRLPGGRHAFRLSLSEAADPGQVLARLSLADGEGKPIAIEPWAGALDPANPFAPPPDGSATRSSFVFATEAIDRRNGGLPVIASVRLAAGLVASGGPVPLAEDWSGKLEFGPRLRLEEVVADSDDEEPALVLRFNDSCRREALEGVLAVEPSIPFTWSHDWRGWRLRGPFRHGERYTVEIRDPAPGDQVADRPRPDRVGVTVGDRRPRAWFTHPGGQLGSRGLRAVEAQAVNLASVTLEVWRVYDGSLAAWVLATGGRTEDWARPVASRSLRLDSERNRTGKLRLVLDDLLPEAVRGEGAVRLRLRWEERDFGVPRPEAQAWRWWGGSADCLLGLSDLGLLARLGREECLVAASSLAGDQPLEGLRLRAFTNRHQSAGEARTGPDGLARLPLPQGLPAGEAVAVLVADRPASASSAALLGWLDLRRDGVRGWDADDWGRAYLAPGLLEAFIHADRELYRPGETVHLRALVRGAGGATPPAAPLRWRILQPDLRLWQEPAGRLDRHGDASLDLALPADLPTGRYRVEVGALGTTTPWGSWSFQVEEFLPQRLAVRTRFRDGGDRPRLALGKVAVEVAGTWLFGAPAEGRTARLALAWEPASFAHPAWQDWTFGDPTGARVLLGEDSAPAGRIELPASTLDHAGLAAWEPDLRRLIPQPGSRPWLLRASGTVLEAGGRGVADGDSVPIDTAESYLGVQEDRVAADADGRRGFRLRLVRPDGSPATAALAVELRLYRRGWNSVLIQDSGADWPRYESRPVLTPIGPAQPLRLADGAAECRLGIPAEGDFVLRVSATGGTLAALPVTGAARNWLASADLGHPEHCPLDLEPTAGATVALVAGERRHPPGSRVAVRLRPPFPGRILLTVEDDSVRHCEWLRLDGTVGLHELAVDPAWGDEVRICATVTRAVDPALPWRSHRASGSVRLRLDRPERVLPLGLAAPAEVRRGGSLELLLRSRPGAQLTLAAVDEGIHRLTGYRSPDPLAFFLGARAPGVRGYDIWGRLLPEARPGGESDPGGGEGGAAMPGSRSPVSARRVVPVALWSGVLEADADGLARCRLALPEGFDGRLRLVAVGDLGPATASASAAVLVRSPLVLQSSWPRLAAPGDAFLVPVTLHNRSASAGTATVSIACSGALSSTAADCSLPIPAGGSAQFSLAVEATGAGLGRARLSARLGEETAQEELELPVRPAAAASATGGELRVAPGRPLRLELPQDLLPGTAGYRLRLGARPRLAIDRGIDRLLAYPYGCAEQTLAALHPLLALRDLGEAISSDRFSPLAIRNRWEDGCARLQAMRTHDGLAMWPGSRDTWPWVTVYAAHVLLEGRAAGQALPPAFLDHLLAACRRYAALQGDEQRRTAAFACFVLARAGQADLAAMARIEAGLRSRAEDETAFWLAAAWLAAGRNDRASGVLPSGLPSWDGERSLGGDLHSPSRRQAVALSILCDLQPEHPALPGLAQRLAREGLEGSTQEVAWSAAALGVWLRRQRATLPCSALRLRVDGRPVADPASWSASAARVVEAEVDGPDGSAAWLAWQTEGVPLQPPGESASGQRISRRWLQEDGEREAGPLQLGDLVRVEVVVEADRRLANVVIEELLPACFEIDDPRFLGSAAPGAAQARPRPRPPLPEREELRDDRLVAMGDLGIWQVPEADPGFAPTPFKPPTQRSGWAMRLQYLARVVAEGRFTVPGPRSSCMYDPGLQAQGAAGQVSVAGMRR